MATFADFGSVYLRVDPAVQKAFLPLSPEGVLLQPSGHRLWLSSNNPRRFQRGPLGVLDVPVSPGTVTHYRHLLYALVLLELMLLIRRFLPTSGTTSGAAEKSATPYAGVVAYSGGPVSWFWAGIATAFYGVIASLY